MGAKNVVMRNDETQKREFKNNHGKIHINNILREMKNPQFEDLSFCKVSVAMVGDGDKITFPSSAQVWPGRIPPSQWKIKEYWQGPAILTCLNNSEIVK